MKTWLTCVSIPLALSCGLALAQNGNDTSTATYQTPQGTLTVDSSQPELPQYGPPPSFASLNRNDTGYITSNEAVAYPPLANDFIHADANRDGRVSKAEYQRWARSQ